MLLQEMRKMWAIQELNLTVLAEHSYVSEISHVITDIHNIFIKSLLLTSSCFKIQQRYDSFKVMENL